MKLPYLITTIGLSLGLLKSAVRGELVEETWVVTPRRSRPPFCPDCFTDRDTLLFNDMNPGPVLRANVGDTLRVTITNNSPNEALTVHYHGILMLDQPYHDGVASRSQCNIAPLQTQVNEFLIHPMTVRAQLPTCMQSRACTVFASHSTVSIFFDAVGTHYYHGHTSLDRMDGLQGVIVIEDPDDPDEAEVRELYDEERVIVLQDWFHRSGPSNRNGLDSVPFIWINDPQSFLINGKGRYEGCLNTTLAATNPYCTANCTVDNYASSIDVEAGKTYLLRIANVASLFPVNFAIANHTLRVISAEGTLVEPFEVQSLDIGVAQRYSVLLQAKQDPTQSYWIETVGRFRSGCPKGQAFLRYGNSYDDIDAWARFESSLKTKRPSRWSTHQVLKRGAPERNITVVGTQVQATNGQLKWAVNNITQGFPAAPAIYSAYNAVNAEGAKPWPATALPDDFVDLPDQPKLTWNFSATLQAQNISTYTEEVKGIGAFRFVMGNMVEMVFQNALALNGVGDYHSWHLHGHSFWVVGQGNGNFDPASDLASFNLIDPVRRDTLTLLPYGWTAIRFEANNPGVWPFHCTISAHFVMGMGLSVMTSIDLLAPPPPGVYSCRETSLDSNGAEVQQDVRMSNSNVGIPRQEHRNTPGRGLRRRG